MLIASLMRGDKRFSSLTRFIRCLLSERLVVGAKNRGLLVDNIQFDHKTIEPFNLIKLELELKFFQINGLFELIVVSLSRSQSARPRNRFDSV